MTKQMTAQQAFRWIARTAEREGLEHTRLTFGGFEIGGLCNAIDKLHSEGRISEVTTRHMREAFVDFPHNVARYKESPRAYLYSPTAKGWEKRVILCMLLAEVV